MTTSSSEIGRLCESWYKNDQIFFLNNTKFSFKSRTGKLAYEVYCEEGAWSGVFDPDMLTLFVYFTKSTMPVKSVSLTRDKKQ